MIRSRLTLDVEYDPDLTGGHPHWGALAAIFAAQAKVKITKVMVELNPPAEVKTKVSQ